MTDPRPGMQNLHGRLRKAGSETNLHQMVGSTVQGCIANEVEERVMQEVSALVYIKSDGQMTPRQIALPSQLNGFPVNPGEIQYLATREQSYKSDSNTPLPSPEDLRIPML